MADQFLSQNQKLEQQQVLAPHLRQSLEILQVPILELRTLIQTELEQNPTLEQAPDRGNETIEIEFGTRELDREINDNSDQEIESLAKLDEEWNDYFSQSRSTNTYSEDDSERHQFYVDSITESVPLQAHLIDQLQMSELNESERKAAEWLIGNIDDDGYLTVDLETLSKSSRYPYETLLYAQRVINDFDPVGVGAQNLADCLSIQLMRLGKLPNSPEQILVKHHLEQLAEHRFSEIAKEMHISPLKVSELAQFISTLDPKPGQRFGTSRTEYVVPEIIVTKKGDEYIIHQTNEFLPRIKISKQYRDLLEDPDASAEVKTYVRNKIRASTQLFRSIEQRQETIKKIATEIVKAQRPFLEEGVSKLQPLTMSQIADIVGVHETTISRATSNKYMQTPVGTFEMRYFFKSGIKQADGQTVSNEAIKDSIARFIAEENPKKPLSDSTLEKMLKENGLNVARRTIAKYREQMNIPSSSDRKFR